MKLQCPRQSLAAALQTVSGVVPTRTPKEILKNVKLHLTEGRATLLATDSEVGIRCEIADVETDSVGDVLLPTQRINAILREVQEEVILLEVTEDALWVKTGRSEFRLSIEDPAEFPDVASFDDDSYFVVAGRQLRQAIQRTLFATDVESTRYALGGVLVEVSEAAMALAATDSRRLSVAHAGCSANGEASTSQRPVVPSKAMQLIERSIQEDDQEVHLAFHANDVLVRSGNSTIYARLVEGRFPKYQDVIPRDFKTSIEMVAGPFLSAVRQSMIVTNEESRGVDFTFADGNLTLNSVGADVGTSRVELPISYEGDAITITFDPKFVADFLKTLDTSAALTLNLIDSGSAAVFKADGDYTYVVMPLSRDEK
ncbi:MAG: DNA polymerase III subunit beta [Planctomycetaceae bacterium]